jgi:plasmid stabilization system protein ParE
MVIIWLPLAENALSSIYRFYKEKSENAAIKIISDIRQATNRLAEQPEMSFREPLLAHRPEIFRSLIVRKKYKIVYYSNKDTIYIADVWDSRQDPKNLRNRLH